MTTSTPLRLAIVGAGLFARDEHLPALRRLEDQFTIVAVWSRTQASADRLASAIGPDVQATTDLTALLARDDIDAVDVVLPIEAMPDAVEQALRAGKHVISEKPVTPTVARGRSLLREHGSQVWMVAENYRYSESFQYAADVIRRGEIGRPLLATWMLSIVMTPANKYYTTDWRRSGTFPGGFILDGGVHHVAVMRLLLGEIDSVSAYSAQVREDLPPTDTLVASLQFASGALGTYAVTFATEERASNELHIVGERGLLQVSSDKVRLTRNGVTDLTLVEDEGVALELAAFGRAIANGEPHRNTPEEALQDVALIEALLQSAQTAQPVNPERIIPNG